MDFNRARFGALVIGAVAAVAAAPPVRAQSPDWPCVQRLVPKLEPGQMWSGPPLEPMGQPSVAMQELARDLIDPKVPPEAVAARVERFRDGLPESERGRTMGQLFALSLDWLNGERAALIRGIERYARGQRSLADRIVAETREVERLEQAPAGDAARLEELRTARAWDTRIFTERQRSLALVCDQPVALEQRAFALARLIQDSIR
jgi:hypothetical protein